MANIVTTSKALVPSSVALVPSSKAKNTKSCNDSRYTQAIEVTRCCAGSLQGKTFAIALPFTNHRTLAVLAVLYPSLP